MNVATWLGALGLERYAPAFESQDVDVQTLRSLTEADLVEIGVRSVGHRRKLLNAIGALQANSAGASEPESATTALQAERRQLTVLYCGMNASAPQALPGHDEELRESIQFFHSTFSKIVEDYDGHVANFYGDSMLGYFGWPRAHEDDIERAVRAGLALVQRVNATPELDGTLSARVGIATGPVVVGDLVRSGPAQEQSAVGLTPNLGARMLSLARPGQVVIDELTRRLLAPSFVVLPLGDHALKGIAAPVPAYAVSGERPSESRFDAHKGRELSPMVGRDRELAMLLDRWEQARGGEGQALVLVGEAGIGKSRIVRAVVDACAVQPHSTIRWQCSAYEMGNALWPVIERLSHSAGLAAQDSAESALQKLEALIGPESNEVTALYATLLGLNGTQRYGPLEMAPQMLRERTLELLVEGLLETAAQQPLLLVVEDAQWIDPTTLELIERCLEHTDRARLLILITSRSDNQPALGAHPNVTRLWLNRLTRAGVQAILARLAGEALQAHTRATIVAQSDGVPLFVEELTKAVLESGAATVPTSLQGSLMARLDCVPEAREVAQAAACIGREFELDLLEAVTEGRHQVALALEKLVTAELMFRVGERGTRKFVFKHALVQEAAYESLLRHDARSLHARILRVLEGRKATPSEILAHHAVRAKQADKAIIYWQNAGNAAFSKSAYNEAVGYLSSAVDVLQAQVDAVDRRAQELELQLLLGQAHRASRGHGAEETKKAFERAEGLLQETASTAGQRFSVRYGLFVGHVSRAETDCALELAKAALEEAQCNHHRRYLHSAYRMVALSHGLLGEFTRSREQFAHALNFLPSNASPNFHAHPEADEICATFSWLAWVLQIQGHFDESLRTARHARQILAGSSDVDAKASRHRILAMRAVMARDSESLSYETEALVELASRHRLTMHRGYANCFGASLGAVLPQNAEEVARRYEQGIAELESVGTRLYVCYFKADMAMALANSGECDGAIDLVQRALADCAATTQGWCEPELWRIRGEILLKKTGSDDDEALRCFERALTLARNQGARLWELRTSVSLARLLVHRGARSEAEALLAPVHAWFIEGHDTPDLVAARTLFGGEPRALT